MVEIRAITHLFGKTELMRRVVGGTFDFPFLEASVSPVGVWSFRFGLEHTDLFLLTDFIDVTFFPT